MESSQGLDLYMWCLPLSLRGQGEAAGGIVSGLRANSMEWKEPWQEAHKDSLATLMPLGPFLSTLPVMQAARPPFQCLTEMGDVYLRPGGLAFLGPVGTPVLGADHGAQALPLVKSPSLWGQMCERFSCWRE